MGRRIADVHATEQKSDRTATQVFRARAPILVVDVVSRIIAIAAAVGVHAGRFEKGLALLRAGQ